MFDTKEQVRQATDIVDLVGRYLHLRRQGRNYVALCPWHDDTRPSLQVNPERQSFKCWVCDIGGDVFSFVMKMEGVGFPEALAMLADQAGISLKRQRRSPKTTGPTEGGGPDPAGAEPAGPASKPEGKRPLYRAMAWVEQQYHDCLLHAPEAEAARRYLEQRGITAESIARFHLGFAPNQPHWILQQAHGSPSRARVLERIGVLARSDEGGWYDRFRGRLLFSIRDAQERPIGIGGRLLPDSGTTSRAKYVNSPETPLFTKSRLLYGLDVARRAMRKSRTALVMEGYTDCILAHQYGFDDAVAVLGTALGEAHLRTLAPYADRVVLVLDGDEAGQRRANEVLEIFVGAQVDLRVVTLPEELDPADFLLEHGAEAFRDLLATRAVDALEHAYQAKTRGIDLAGDVHGASRALEEILAIVAKAPRLRDDTTHEYRFREERILQRLAASFRVPEAAVRERLTVLRRSGRARVSRPAGPSVPEAPSGAACAVDPWERELLEVLLRHPGCVEEIRSQLRVDERTSATCRMILQACYRLADRGDPPTFERLMLDFDDPAVKSLLVDLDEEASAKEMSSPESLLKELFRQRTNRSHDPTRLAALRDQTLDESQKAAMLREMARELRARHGISDPTDG